MTDDLSGFGDRGARDGDLIEIDLNFESMRRFQAEFSPNLSADGLFIDTGEPLEPGAVVRFRVILPEGFVLLEGTAVVEWNRRADAVSDGPPGMALRFVTLSPQNQELVEQLVQDHLDAGGTPFNLDVRPAPTDFPTDALEGAPGRGASGTDEGYRLTIRRAGLGDEAEAEALRALAAATPGGIDQPSDGDFGEEHLEDEPHGFEILTEPRWSAAEPPAAVDEGLSVPAAVDDARLGEPAVDSIGDPPELDWTDDEPAQAAVRPVEAEAATGPESAPPAWIPSEFSWAPRDPVVADAPPAPVSASPEPGVLRTPTEFDDGPEVIGDLEGGELGSPAFDVSLPEPDDGPDPTPVLPDEGRNDVTVPDEDGDGPERKRRWWPWAVAALFLVALAGGLLWPGLRDRLEGRTETASATAAEAVATSEDTAPTAVPEPTPEVEQTTEGASEADGEGQGENVALQAGEQQREPPANGDGEQGQPTEDAGTGEPAGAAPAETAVAATDLPTPSSPMPPADVIASIDVTDEAGGAAVTIRGNGSLEDGAVSVETLTSPPRVLVRLRGIVSPYRPYALDSAAPGVSGLRIGHHENRRPPELWVVIDLADDRAVVRDIDVGGDLVRLVVARP